MHELAKKISHKLSRIVGFTVDIDKGLISDGLIIKFGDREKFKIDSLLFGGYLVKYIDPLIFDKSVVEITIPDKNDLRLYDVIEKLIFGEIMQINNGIDEYVVDYKKLKTKKEINKVFDEQEGSNMHAYNVLLLAIHYGTEKDIEDIKRIIVTNEMAGYDLRDAYTLHEKLYKQFKNAK